MANKPSAMGRLIAVKTQIRAGEAVPGRQRHLHIRAKLLAGLPVSLIELVARRVTRYAAAL